jgi:hypothetical protein
MPAFTATSTSAKRKMRLSDFCNRLTTRAPTCRPIPDRVRLPPAGPLDPACLRLALSPALVPSGFRLPVSTTGFIGWSFA